MSRLAGGVELDRRLAVGLRRPVRVEQAELDLLREHPPDGPVDQRLVDPSGRDLVQQRLAVAERAGQLDVDPGGQRVRGRLALGLRDPVHDLQEGHRPVVRDDGAGEAPLVAQHAGEQGVVGGHRDPVDVGVGVHHAADAGVPDGVLERRQDHVGELARPHADRGVVAGGPRGGVPGEVLEGGDDAVLLQPAHVRRPDLRDEVRVLAQRLLDPTPAVVADDVEHRRQPLVDADRGHVAADRRRHLVHQRGVEGGRPGERPRVDGRLVGGEPGQALLVHDGRDPQPGRGHQRPLQLVHPGGRPRPRSPERCRRPGSAGRGRGRWPRRTTSPG